MESTQNYVPFSRSIVPRIVDPNSVVGNNSDVKINENRNRIIIILNIR
jgi:hypothetical protein